MDEIKEDLVSSEIQNLCENPSISHVNCEPHCDVPIGCVLKKNKKLRLIMNLQHLNIYSQPKKFRYMYED